jgi:hypothetical protein
LVKKRFSKESQLLILGWLLVAPLPASITTEAPHAMRIFSVLPVPQIIGALGLVTLFQQKIFIKIGLIMVVVISMIFLFHNYFNNFPVEQSDSFQYSLAKAIPDVLKIQDRYQKIIFSNKDNLYQSYMFFLFFSQYDPRLYLREGGTISGGYNEPHQFGKYEFRPISWDKEKKDGTVLYVGNLADFSQEVQPIQIFKSLLGKEDIKIAE